MRSRKILINATAWHTGGGRTLLNGFIKGLAQATENVTIFIDARFEPVPKFSDNIEFVKVSRLKRFFIDFTINAQAKSNDLVIYVGNLPPVLRFTTKNVLLILSSRFFVDNVSFRGFGFKLTMQILLEKIYYNTFLHNVSGIIVQTSTMRRLLKKSGFQKDIFVWPFDDIGEDASVFPTESNKEPSSFIYVASLLPYKNHKRLLLAWKNLKNAGIDVKLYLTLDQDNKIARWMKNFVTANELNVTLLVNLKRQELIKYYQKTEALIYPSFFEAYGLPLIEAKKFKLKILASDIDYCWDFITPDEFFNPYDVDSITRSVKRYLNIPENKDRIYTPREFVDNLKIS